MPETAQTNGYTNGHHNNHNNMYETEDGSSFLFTSESVGEGHPGEFTIFFSSLIFPIFFRLCGEHLHIWRLSYAFAASLPDRLRVIFGEKITKPCGLKYERVVSMLCRRRRHNRAASSTPRAASHAHPTFSSLKKKTTHLSFQNSGIVAIAATQLNFTYSPCCKFEVMLARHFWSYDYRRHINHYFQEFFSRLNYGLFGYPIPFVTLSANAIFRNLIGYHTTLCRTRPWQWFLMWESCKI